MDDKKKIRGWGRPTPTARKFHYFDGLRSLCGNYGWLGPQEALEEGKDVHPDNCAACQRKRLAMVGATDGEAHTNG